MVSNRWVLLVAVPLGLLLAVEAYLSVRFAIDERAEQAWVVHTYLVIGRFRGVLSHVQEVEAAQRGYIITRQSRFLDPYKTAIALAHNDLESVKTLTADNPRQQARVVELRRLVDDLVNDLDATLAKSAPPVASMPEVLAAMKMGKARMDELRAELDRAVAEENKLLSLRLSARRLAERNEIVSTGLAALIALVVMLGAAALLLRSNARLLRSEAKLENESAILQTTIDSIRDGIAMFAANGELCVFNDTFFSFFEFPHEIVRKGLHLSDLEAFVGTVAGSILSSMVDGRHEHRHASLNGRELNIYRSPVSTGGCAIVVKDITAQMQAELVARQAQKMEAVGHLTGGVAHDFNNILQIIAANLERTAQDVRDDSRSAERIRNALNAVANGARLTRQLLAFARQQPLNPRSTNIDRVIQDMADLLRRTLGESVEVECISGGGLWNCLIDANHIESVVLNLAINARDAMPGGGKLTIEVANAYLDDAYAAQHLEVASGQYVMVAVSDTGSGMSPETLDRAFEPFFTTKPEGSGTGLGLSQVYGFVRQSGGHVKIYSEFGQGTTVKLYLPRTQKPPEVTEQVAAELVEGDGERILVVENDEAVRNAVVGMVSELGYSVLEAENAEQALVILSSDVAIDLLFTDVVMPGPINTKDLARRAQQLHPNIQVLYTSGYTRNTIMHNDKLDDAIVLLSKPYSRDELARKLRSLLDLTKSSLQSPSASSKAHPTPRPGRVLIVEDVVLIRMTTVDMVEEVGFQVVEVGSAEEALSAIRSDPEISILLTDLGLPGMTGHQLIDEAVKLKPDLKIIVASGYSSERDGRKISARAVQLMKPFDIEQLRRALET